MSARRLRPASVGLAPLALALAVAACAEKKVETPQVSAVAVDRRSIVVDAQATGTVEPINVIEVKSKASGQITRIPVETGTQVRAGQLLVQGSHFTGKDER